MAEKGCFIRIGSASEPMPVSMIEELFARRTRNSLSRIRSPRQELSFEQLRIYYQEAGLTLNDKFATNLELLTEDGGYNYAAYLLVDQNGNSVQVAKYPGTDRVDLLESKEYGYCCLVKTCKAVLDRLEGQENRNITKITARERIERPLWDKVALREAVINAIIHNDYTTELVPKFEVFVNRLEITSAGCIHFGQEQQDFFAGYSMPRNKTLMRVFKDLGMVEYLGSGIPRILKAYTGEAYTFSSHFIRASFPVSAEALQLAQQIEDTQVSTKYRVESGLESGLESELAQNILNLLAKTDLGHTDFNSSALSKSQIAKLLGYKSISSKLNQRIKELLEQQLIERTLPDKPNSRLQKYRLSTTGQALLKNN